MLANGGKYTERAQSKNGKEDVAVREERYNYNNLPIMLSSVLLILSTVCVFGSCSTWNHVFYK